MKPRLLHSVIDDVLAAAEQWPEIANDVLHFVFDEAQDIREGLFETKTHVLGDGTVEIDGVPPVKTTVVVTQTLATERLVHFAHAVSRGFIPHVMAAGGA
ncbi:hypothetical protein [Trinickia dinghuensis]|uniref:Uncharacterized protein n=1 Tax=Trinickia dinghuensis TaxID=2291023 RepID=A0A3D8K1K2_9BURK|nr:hypothetical protein [Trinickia dinghuensis]RDU99198.1 hypothetical protein DWV00_08720 [Trinickia dinghuensis]